MIKKEWLFVLIALCTACAPSKMMTYHSYQNVSIGETIFDVQSRAGNPYEIRDIGASKQEYIYIERIPTSQGMEVFRRYTLIVQDGKVIGKSIDEEMSSPIQMELQN